MWYVILFMDENNIAVCPSSWYVNESKECFWPPSSWSTAAINKCIKHKSLPDDEWKPYHATILGKYATYEIAMKKQIKAQMTDKLTTTDDELTGRGKRKKTENRILTYSSDADDTSSRASEESDLMYPKIPEPLVPLTCDSEGKTSVVQPKVSEKSKKITSAKKATTVRKIRSRSLSPGAQNNRHIANNQSQKSRVGDYVGAIETEYGPETTDISYKITSNPGGNEILNLLQTIQQDNAEFRIHVLRKLNLINLKVNDIQQAMETLNNNKNGQGEQLIDNDEELQFKDTFPLMNEENLKQLEGMLQIQSARKVLATDLARTGGVDVKDIVRRLMYRIFTNELGELYSWDGAKKKKKFKELKIAGVIIDAIRLNKSTKEATDVEIISWIKKWLVRCKDRKLKKNVPNAEDENMKI